MVRLFSIQVLVFWATAALNSSEGEEGLIKAVNFWICFVIPIGGAWLVMAVSNVLVVD